MNIFSESARKLDCDVPRFILELEHHLELVINGLKVNKSMKCLPRLKHQIHLIAEIDQSKPISKLCNGWANRIRQSAM